jgi:hypothetical protein
LQKRKKENMTFLLIEIKIAIQVVSLWYFHVYLCYTANWFISSKLSIILP